MKWKLLKYMSEQRIKSFRELSQLTGIDYRTLLKHIENINQMRVYELKTLAEVLRLTDEDVLELLRGEG